MDKYLQGKLNEHSPMANGAFVGTAVSASQGGTVNGDPVRVRWLGRARRSEYIPIAILCNIIISAIGKSAGDSMGATVISLVLLTVLVIESIRRLHDMGKSGWWTISFLIPFVWLMTWSKGQAGPNEYGPDPRTN